MLVAVGERGHILYTNDRKNWQQAKVETRATLTAVHLVDEQTGWAVGHDAVIMKTENAGKNWQLIHRARDDETPLLDIMFHNEKYGFAIGAYGLFYVTENGGKNWYAQEISVIDDGSTNDTDALPFDLHLNAISHAGGDRYYIATESGYLLRSDDAGTNWQQLPTPYVGSFFGVQSLSLNELLLFGLKGNLYRSENAGLSWQQLETGTESILTDALLLNDGTVLICGMAGTLLLSRDNGYSFSLIQMKHRHDYSSVLKLDDKRFILSGEAGFEYLQSSFLELDTQ